MRKYILNPILLIAGYFSLCNANALSSSSPERTALVIGNSDYSQGRLRNPINDAEDIAEVLQSAGFDVILKKDVNQKKMEGVIADFGQKIEERGGVRLFYYAGHGVQHNGENYLIPIGAEPESNADLRYKAVNLGWILDKMGEAIDGNGFNVVILDACRNNPFRSFDRNINIRGLTTPKSPIGTLISFATSPGEIASDGTGRNGTYTESLIKYIAEPGLDIKQVFDKVAEEVTKKTKYTQAPWVSYSLIGNFSFFEPEETEPAAPPTLPVNSNLATSAEIEELTKSPKKRDFIPDIGWH